MEYQDFISISMVPRNGNGFDKRQYRARYVRDDELYADLEGYGPSPEIAMAMLQLAQIDDMLESLNLNGADQSE